MSCQLKLNDGMDVFEPTHYKCAGTGVANPFAWHLDTNLEYIMFILNMLLLFIFNDINKPEAK
jgi:hypothetical protein